MMRLKASLAEEQKFVLWKIDTTRYGGTLVVRAWIRTNVSGSGVDGAGSGVNVTGSGVNASGYGVNVSGYRTLNTG
jgi:hypothetical protein